MQLVCSSMLFISFIVTYTLVTLLALSNKYIFEVIAIGSYLTSVTMHIRFTVFG